LELVEGELEIEGCELAELDPECWELVEPEYWELEVDCWELELEPELCELEVGTACLCE
jgi:hypothetical protein